MSNTLVHGQECFTQPRPVLKWAGGKTQILEYLLTRTPKNYGKYIEPFIGGGALFFALSPEQAVIADSNPELINLYSVIANEIDSLVHVLNTYKNEKEIFYQERQKDWTELSSVEAAARTVYLNRTCFNGLYRVNKKGQFNVPYGAYANPKICDTNNLYAASKLLQNKIIVCEDYKDVLKKYAQPNDFIFLDPPYLPVSEYSDFKRYTKEQFYSEDHQELAVEVARLSEMGCHVVLTNSNHPLVHDLYSRYQLDVYQTRRNINSQASKRKGEDIIVTVTPGRHFYVCPEPGALYGQVSKYPSTRYMGSKAKLIPHIQNVIRQFEYDTAMDLFSGSGIVSYMLKAEGKKVVSNDYMALCSNYTKALIENNSTVLPMNKAESLLTSVENDRFVQNTFAGLYFTDEENILIDNIRANIPNLRNSYERAIAISALTRACFKKRPRGIFTYVGYKHDDGRKDLRKTFEEQFFDAIRAYNRAVFDNAQANKSRRGDAMTIRPEADLVYMDPPYCSLHSDNEYVRRYHFVEGIACNWQGVDMQCHTKTKKFKSYPTPFSNRNGVYGAFNRLFRKFKDSIQIVSYSSNSLPTLDEMVKLMSQYKQHVEVIDIDYRYSFGTQSHKIGSNNNNVKEYLFVGY